MSELVAIIHQALTLYWQTAVLLDYGFDSLDSFCRRDRDADGWSCQASDTQGEVCIAIRIVLAAGSTSSETKDEMQC